LRRPNRTVLPCIVFLAKTCKDYFYVGQGKGFQRAEILASKEQRKDV
jgi:hypothetical protein